MTIDGDGSNDGDNAARQILETLKGRLQGRLQECKDRRTKVQADFDAVQDAMRNQYAKTTMVGVAETTSLQVQAELQRALGHLQELKQIVDDDISRVEGALDGVIQKCESIGLGM